MRYARGAIFAALIWAAHGMAQPASAQVERGPDYGSVHPMSVSVDERVHPQMRALLDQLIVEGRGMRLDGVQVFEANDKFLPGKIAIALSYAIEEAEPGTAERERYLAGFRTLSRLTLEDANDTWGIYYYLSALDRLQTLGVLEAAVEPDVLTRLRERLDWRTFVDIQTQQLIDLPNNYYGVAFSVAELRHGLGWEGPEAGGRLLAKTLDHYREFSGTSGFADETDGEGRFDRYSVLLIGEIAQRFIQTDAAPPPEVLRWLRASVDLLLPRLNTRGEGFEYGRSIGPYGETAFLEVLSAAAVLDLLSPQEEAAAYAFSSRVAARYADYWSDSGTGSVNLWDHGRKTDAYRGKHRILGENLSLSHQLIYTDALWRTRGWHERRVDTDLDAFVADRPKSVLTYFSQGEFDRALLTFRDADRLISLPIINGGAGQHMNTPYYPIPFSPGLLAGSPDESYPQLVPAVTLADGSELRPLAYFKDVRAEISPDRTVVTWVQPVSDRMGDNAPQPDPRVAFETRYEFSAGAIVRRDRIVPAEGETIARIEMQFASFSSQPEIDGGDVRYAAGPIAAWRVDGLLCEQQALEPTVHASSTAAFRSLVRCQGQPAPGIIDMTWTLDWRSPVDRIAP